MTCCKQRLLFQINGDGTLAGWNQTTPLGHSRCATLALWLWVADLSAGGLNGSGSCKQVLQYGGWRATGLWNVVVRASFSVSTWSIGSKYLIYGDTVTDSTSLWPGGTKVAQLQRRYSRLPSPPGHRLWFPSVWDKWRFLGKNDSTTNTALVCSPPRI